jgi:glycine/D-amino acid oxidase-like deaminating enzyme
LGSSVAPVVEEVAVLLVAPCLLAAMEGMEKPMTRRIVVIGGGVVGSAVAVELTRHDRVSVTVVEQAPGDRLVGSTGHAPGLFGLLGQAPVLTGLAGLSLW